VCLPPQYFSEPDRRFPVAYLFYGTPGVPADLFRGGQADDAAAKLADHGSPMIVVAPRMSHDWLDDPECVDGKKERAETHFLQDVLPTIDTTMRTIPSRDGRVIGGMSAGGYCALNLGLRNRGLFGTIIDLSGFTRPTHAGGLDTLFGSGPAATATASANSPDAYARRLPATPMTRIWLDCGTADTKVLDQMRAIDAVLSDRGFDVRLHLRPGSHTFHVWAPALGDSLTWAASQLDHAA